jgi:hypothetical protein
MLPTPPITNGENQDISKELAIFTIWILVIWIWDLFVF